MSVQKSLLRSVTAVVTVVLLTLLATAPAFAAKPHDVTGGEPPGNDMVLPLTPEQEASRLLKEELIGGIMSSHGSDGGITPQYVCQFEPCEPTLYVLTVYPRQQDKGYFCGPGVVQIVSSYSWGKTGTQNKYSQQTISDTWTRTEADIDGDGHPDNQTYLAYEIAGMNGASVLPPNFAYMQKHNPTFTNWHSTIIAGTYYWHLPLAAGVIPRKQGAQYYLSSWNKVSNGGHYIELHGYQGRATDALRYVYYSDTAGTYADSVAANWKQGSYAVYETMMYNNGNMIY